MAIPFAVGAAARAGGGRVGNLLSAGSSITQGISSYSKSMGTLNDEVVVTVRGDKKAKKADLYKLAAAVAFGQTQRWTAGLWGLNPPPGSIMMENHLNDITVTFTLRFSRSLTSILACRAFTTDSVSDFTKNLPVFAGPDDDYMGGKWNFSSLLTSDVPLPFNNRSVLYASSSCPDPTPDPTGAGAPVSNVILSPNPRPMGDCRSRGSLVGLVFSALSNPGSTELMKMPVATNVSNSTFTGGP